MDRLAIVIPARMASTRFPGKPLVDLGGKPMIQWVHEACVASDLDARILIATPDTEIAAAARAFGAESILTRLDHVSGTDRIAEVAESVPAAAYLNVQGDEPLINPENIRRCSGLMLDPEVEMGTLYVFAGEEEVDNPAVVKVVADLQGRALYFSRSVIPFARNPGYGSVKKHLGIYIYRADLLGHFTKWPVSPLEQSEGLEQLRFLEHGVRIQLAEGLPSATAVDTPEQADEVRSALLIRTKAGKS